MRKIIAGNWKMHKTQAEALEFLDDVQPLFDQTLDREIVLCCPFTLLVTLSQRLHRIKLGAQNLHWAASGAYTGEIAAPMLVELGVQYVLVGHSERRRYFGDTDTTVNLRLRAAQRYNLIPILCVGETKSQHDAGATETTLLCQLEQDLEGIVIHPQKLVIAYEPVWAIGSGNVCSPDEADRVIGFIRNQLATPDLSILYGGSVKPDNIDLLMAQPQIDGALVGSASLVAQDFARIVNFRG